MLSGYFSVIKHIHIRFLLIVAFASFMTNASAAYLWYGFNQQGPSADSVCRAILTTAAATRTSSTGETSALCQYQNVGSDVWQTLGTLNRVGVSDDPPPQDCPAVDAGSMDVTIGWGTGPQAGSGIAAYSYDPSKTSPGTRSYCAPNKCTIAPSGEASSCAREQTPSAGGYYRLYCTYPMKQTGGSCSGQEPPPGVPGSEPSTPNGSKDGSCPAGSVSAGQDSFGMTICKGKKPPTDAPPINTVTGPKTPDGKGGTDQTTIDTVTNGDGSTTKTTTTTNTGADGSSTTAVTSVTSSTPAGAPGTPSKPADVSDMCKQHPELTVCQNSQVMGSCESISCTGDAIQCATLRAAATLQCRDKEDRDALKASSLLTLGDRVLGGNDPMNGQIASNLTGSTVDLSNPNLDQSGFLGAGSCLGTKTFTVMKKSFSYSFSAVCANIQPLRYIMLIIGFICAYMIISKSILQS